MTGGEAFRSALGDILAHKLRSGLTTLGIMFGVGAVIAMLAIGAGAGRHAQAMIDRLGVRNVLLRAVDVRGEKLAEVRKKSLGLSLRDAEAIREAVPAARVVVPRVKVETYKVFGGGGKSEAKVFGVGAAYGALMNLAVAEGRFLDETDERHHAQTCVIGAGVRRDIFGFGPVVGEPIKVNDLWLEVVGVVAADALGTASFQGVPLGSADREIYLPASSALRKLDHNPLSSPLEEIVVQLAPDAPAAATAAVIRTLVDRLHGGADDYEVVVPEALLEQSRQTHRLFSIVMVCIAGISLLVGGIGIMNIMLASVLERTREIGVRRAVGARRSDIVSQFLAESFSISLFGGMMGVAAGVGIARGVAAYADWPTVVTASSIALSLTVSLVVGLVSGLYPALRAASVPPVAALRYE